MRHINLSAGALIAYVASTSVFAQNVEEVVWTLLTKVETSCDRILIAGGANVEAEWEQGPAV